MMVLHPVLHFVTKHVKFELVERPTLIEVLVLGEALFSVAAGLYSARLPQSEGIQEAYLLEPLSPWVCQKETLILFLVLPGLQQQ